MTTKTRPRAVVAPAKTAKTAKAATLTLSSKNYSSWSLRGWLLCRFAGLDFDDVMVSSDDPKARRELLLLAPSILVPCLNHDGASVWNTAAIGYYLDETLPKAGLLPADRIARAHCRAICGEMNAGFANLRSALLDSNASKRSGSTASSATAAPTCSAASAAWPTPCSRPWPCAS